MQVELQEMRPSDHVQALRAGQLDISLTGWLSVDGQLAAVLLWRDPVVLAVLLDHRLDTRTRDLVAGISRARIWYFCGSTPLPSHNGCLNDCSKLHN